METAAKHMEGGQFKGDPPEIQELMELLDGYHEFLCEQGHKFLAKETRQLQSTITEALEEEEAR